MYILNDPLSILIDFGNESEPPESIAYLHKLHFHFSSVHNDELSNFSSFWKWFGNIFDLNYLFKALIPKSGGLSKILNIWSGFMAKVIFIGCLNQRI